MGRSNVTENLERDLSYHLGEREQVVARINRIQQLFESLPELRERLVKLDSLIAAGEMLLKDRDPDWTSGPVIGDPFPLPIIAHVVDEVGRIGYDQMDRGHLSILLLHFSYLVENFFHPMVRNLIRLHIPALPLRQQCSVIASASAGLHRQ